MADLKPPPAGKPGGAYPPDPSQKAAQSAMAATASLSSGYTIEIYERDYDPWVLDDVVPDDTIELKWLGGGSTTTVETFDDKEDPVELFYGGSGPYSNQYT